MADDVGGKPKSWLSRNFNLNSIFKHLFSPGMIIMMMLMVVDPLSAAAKAANASVTLGDWGAITGDITRAGSGLSECCELFLEEFGDEDFLPALDIFDDHIML